MTIYGRNFDKTKCMYFLQKGGIFFDRYNEVWVKYCQKNIYQKVYIQ